MLLLTLHHIAADGWSIRLLWRELEVAYAAYRRNGRRRWANYRSSMPTTRSGSGSSYKGSVSGGRWTIGESNWQDWSRWSCRPTVRGRGRLRIRELVTISRSRGRWWISSGD